MSVHIDLESMEAVLPAYEFGEELGIGAWGIVRAARHRQLGREVAVKQLPPVAAADESVRARFVAEARVLAALDHPHIVPVYDFVEREGLCLLIMERLTGGTLWDRFVAGDLDVQASCAAILAACAGLQHAHQRGTLHRDVKPQNLMFSGDGVLKVTDFGMAKVLGGSTTLASRDGQVLGTPAYMAPEQASGAQLSASTDVYATAMVLYELLSGRMPFPKDSKPIATLYRHVHEQPWPLRDIAPWIPDGVAEVTMTALSTAPVDRYDSAESFGVALASACADAWGSAWLPQASVGVADSSLVAAATGEHVIPHALRMPAEHPSLDSAPAGLVPVSDFDGSGGDSGAWSFDDDGIDLARPTRRPQPRTVRRRQLLAGALVAAILLTIVGALALLRMRRPAADEPAATVPADEDQAAGGSGSAPVAGSWRQLRDAPIARHHVAVAAADGAVWVFGGIEDNRATSKTGGYDPAIDTWKSGPNLPNPVHGAMAVNYQGELVVIGGWLSQGSDLTGMASDEVYVLRDGKWKRMGSLNQPRADGAAAVVGDRIVVMGGQADGEALSNVEVFDGSRWRVGEDLPTPRDRLAAASDGAYAYAVGGRDPSTETVLAAVERYDPVNDRWEELADLPTPRSGLGAAIVEGRLIAAGGQRPTRALDEVEAYDPAEDRWSTLPPLREARHGLGLAAVGSSVYAINGATRPSSGRPPEQATAAVETLTVAPTTAQAGAAWRGLRESFTARQQVALTERNGILWVLGGLEGDHATPRSEGYDAAADRWRDGVDLPLPIHHAMAVTYNDELVVIGGWTPEGSGLSAITSDRVYALRDGRWVQLPRLRQPRAAGAAAVVDGRIVVMGGQAGGKLVKTTEIFDGRRWTEAADLPTPREHLAAATDGRYVYAVGGRKLSADYNSPLLERYDPAADRWSTLPPMPTPRGGLAATFAGGRLIAAGGEDPTGVFETVEAYDPATRRWTTLPPLNTPRHGLGMAAIGGNVYALNGATRPTHAESSAVAEVLTLR